MPVKTFFGNSHIYILLRGPRLDVFTERGRVGLCPLLGSLAPVVPGFRDLEGESLKNPLTAESYVSLEVRLLFLPWR